MVEAAKKSPHRGNRAKSIPKGKLMLADAMRNLLIDKDFQSITTAEIARVAKANEALIYRYFGDKRGLLHYVLEEYMKTTQVKINAALEELDGSIEKLKKIIWMTLDIYNSHRVFAKILLIEVRNYPGYFESETYGLIKAYGKTMLTLIEKAVEEGKIRNDSQPVFIRNAIIGAVEHLCLPYVIFGKQFSPNVLSDNVYKIVFEGVLK